MEARAETGPVAAPLRARLLAAGADFVVVTAIGIAVNEALRVVLAQGIGLGPPPGLYPASMFVGGWVYFVLCEIRLGGRTVGKMGAGLRVAGSPDALWCSVRYVAKVLQLLLGRGLLFGAALFDERRRALHDHL
ncbi:MAG: RDD family protein, partial [Acidobacteria bacterium]|nr:RDD family protein [Acidobacteriota bacterium]